MLKHLAIIMIVISIIITLVAYLLNLPFLFLVIFLPPIMITFGKYEKKYCPYCGAEMKGNTCPVCGFTYEEYEEEL